MTHDDLAELIEDQPCCLPAPPTTATFWAWATPTCDAPGTISIYPKSFDAENVSWMPERLQRLREAMAKMTRWSLLGYSRHPDERRDQDRGHDQQYAGGLCVAISLVVSSIMIGVITYISVLERREGDRHSACHRRIQAQRLGGVQRRDLHYRYVFRLYRRGPACFC